MRNTTHCSASNCPFSHMSCTECALYRGRHHYLMFSGHNGGADGPKDLKVYFQALEELSNPWVGKGFQAKNGPRIQLKVVDMENNKTGLCELEEAKAWDWSNPEIMRLIDGRQVKSFDTLFDMVCYRAEKGHRDVEIRVFPRFMLLAGG